MVKDIFSVVGKTAIVTGASSGLGEEFAQILASRGANVVLAARRTDRLQELAESITRDGGTALPITCDVADSAQVKDMVATAWDRFGREMRTVFAAAAFVVAGVATAQAADIAAKTGYEAKLDADSSALVYYNRRARRLPCGGNNPAGLNRPGGGRAFRDGVGDGAVGNGFGSARRGRGAGADRAQQRRRPPTHCQAERRRFRPMTSRLRPKKVRMSYGDYW